MQTTNLLIRQFQFSSNVAKLIQFANKSGFQCSLKECLRAPEMEQIYKNRGQSWLVNPNADKHLNSLAIDICFFIGANWVQDYPTLKPIGDYWATLLSGNVWGGSWGVRDLMHFQAV